MRRYAGAVKSYGQWCSVAKALDVVGERWSLLLVRELFDGPKRYVDLLDGSPGISTDVLAARLRDLEEAGVIARRTLPPPAGVEGLRADRARARAGAGPELARSVGDAAARHQGATTRRSVRNGSPRGCAGCCGRRAPRT